MRALSLIIIGMCLAVLSSACANLSTVDKPLSSWSPDMEENYLKRVGGDRSDELLVFVSFSGGGQYGAFGVGFLNGWQETGTRPQFEIVTGVSAGALMATHAWHSGRRQGAG
jgi:hypothetical protein